MIEYTVENTIETSSNQRLEHCAQLELLLYNWDLHAFSADNLIQTWLYPHPIETATSITVRQLSTTI